MICKMENDQIDEMDIEVLSSMWPEDVGNDDGKQFNIEKLGGEQDMLEEVTFVEDPTVYDFKRLLELTNYSEKGSSQLAYLVKSWEYKEANASRLLREEIDILSKQRQEAKRKELEIQEEHRFEEERFGHEKRPVSILDGFYDIEENVVPHKRNDVVFQDKIVEIDAEYDTVMYWKHQAMQLEKLLEESIQREQTLTMKLQENIKNLEMQSSPVEELSQILKRADNFLHFVLQNAPVVIGHQDKELRYRFIYNHFPRFKEDDIIGKTDVEIFTGGGVKESQDFKREVLERGLPAKREITFDTPLFGSKTFLIYVEPVFSKSGETIGINYMGMDVSDQVIKREKMAKLREEIAVQKAKETELNKMIHITEETMRAKQMLATMSHEIRSPLSGVVSIAEILSTTKLDREQHQLLDVMLSSGDLVLQLINDILDLSKVESGVMKLEATKFRPREVVRHVLQTAAASLQKTLTLEGHLADDVPMEVIGDVLRIRQILTNLISNAVKFTHEGKVGIKIYVVPEPSSHKCTADQSTNSPKIQKENGFHKQTNGDGPYHNCTHHDEPRTPKSGCLINEDETTVWIRCDVYDTGIGIPDNALPTLFKKYMQVSADHARKYGGTGLGLAICKQLVELMGGFLTVSSQEHSGSTFTFVLPYKVSILSEYSDDPDDLSDMASHDDITAGFFTFQPHTLSGFNRTNKSTPHNSGTPKEISSPEDASSVDDATETVSESTSRYSPDFDMDEQTKVRCEKQEKSDISSKGVSSCSTEVTELLPRPKILLVEDNKVNVMVTKSMMKQIGHTIDVVNNGVEAVRAVQGHNYDLILMDVSMPVMDGLQATRLIRSFEETGNWKAAMDAGIEQIVPSSDALPNGHDCGISGKRIPIIAMTANALSESADECYANGMDSFMSKPVTFQKLKQCLEQYIH